MNPVFTDDADEDRQRLDAMTLLMQHWSRAAQLEHRKHCTACADPFLHLAHLYPASQAIPGLPSYSDAGTGP